MPEMGQVPPDHELVEAAAHIFAGTHAIVQVVNGDGFLLEFIPAQAGAGTTFSVDSR